MATESKRDKDRSQDFDTVLRQAAKQTLSPEEIRAQRVSFAMGTMGNSNKMTRRQVEELVTKQCGY